MKKSREKRPKRRETNAQYFKNKVNEENMKKKLNIKNRKRRRTDRRTKRESKSTNSASNRKRRSQSGWMGKTEQRVGLERFSSEKSQKTNPQVSQNTRSGTISAKCGPKPGQKKQKVKHGSENPPAEVFLLPSPPS